MPAVLAINPNTTAAVTAKVEFDLRRFAPGVDWRSATGRFGARYITSESAFAVASHAAVDAWAEHAGAAPVDAVLLACFGDPGLFALREMSPVPVVGLAEASMREALRIGERFTLVTGGPRWAPMLERLAQNLGYAHALATVRASDMTGGQAAENPERAVEVFSALCRQARAEDGAEVVILGGAGFAGLGALVSVAAGFPVIDSVEAGAKVAARLAQGEPCPYRLPGPAAGIESIGLAPALAARLVQ